MIRIAITQAAFDAIAATLPVGSVGYENETNERGERYVWLAPNVVDRLRAMRGPGESYSEAILRTVRKPALQRSWTLSERAFSHWASSSKRSAAGRRRASPPACATIALTQFGVRRSDILSGRRMLDVLATLQDLDLLQSDEPARHHAVEDRQKRLDVVLGVHDFDHQRQVLAHVEDFHAVQPGRMTEAHRAAKNRGARKMKLAGFEHDRLVERATVKPRILVDEDAQKHRVAREIHESASLEPPPGSGHESRGPHEEAVGQSYP
jgi:hypothetical protein